MSTHAFALRRSTASLIVAVAVMATSMLAFVASASAATFDPELVISNDNMRHSTSMSASQIQAFLETQPGPLKSLVTTDHAGVKRRASTIIWLACQEYKINPKVMLTMLQKEQSLLTRTTLAKNTLSRAIGAGCPNAYTNRYPGFGNQMWHGARLLDSYGEGHSAFPVYYEGIAKKTYTGHIHPKNLATFKLYVYNPSIGAKAPYGDLSSQASSCSGNANFWLIYRRYFGSTFGHPRMRTVYRFRHRTNGTFLYTASIAERHKLVQPDYARRWRYEGAKFSWDTSVTPTATVPVYRFRNRSTGKYSFTTSQTLYRERTSTAGRKTWSYGGVAFRVARTSSPGAVPIYRFRSRINGSVLLTASKTSAEKLRTYARYRVVWRYEGVPYYLPRVQTP